jgi:hypothetical protein
MSQVPKAAEALEWILPLSGFGYDRGITQVFGGVTRAQWLTTLTGDDVVSLAHVVCLDPCGRGGNTSR